VRRRASGEPPGSPEPSTGPLRGRAASRPTRSRTSFDEVAELYERARPGYPAELFDDLAALVPGPRLLEIGCGTGQASVPLAERGFELVCVELGARLAAIAREKLARFPHVEVVQTDFETWEPERAGFDGVVSFTAFHWIDPELRYAKPARLLRPGGVLAVAMTHGAVPVGGDPFFLEVQEDYDAVRPPGEEAPHIPRPDEIEGLSAELAASGHFAPIAERRYEWELAYDADSYIELLQTYSDHRAMEPARRRELHERIRRRIEARPGGTVRKTHLTTLDVALVTA
jgi:SAM-dependent methyltransferase